MDKAIILLMFIFTSFHLFANGKKEDITLKSPTNSKTLVIYTYDSFASEWGPAKKVITPFEKEYKVDVNLISCGDAGQVLSRVILEKNNPKADIILGIDNNLFSKAINYDVLTSFKPQNIKSIPDFLIFDKTYHVIPFDYGYFAINYDSNIIKNPPKNLEELTREKYKKSLILMDPRTSSPGLGFLLWTIAVYGDNFTTYWKKLKPSILTITDSWDSGYGLFSSGEAPMVLSYTTSPSYHIKNEGTERFKALAFEEGNYMQIETMGLIKGLKHRKEAEQFIEYMLTETFQKELPLTNYMIPVAKNVPLPDSFDSLPQVDKPLLIDSSEINEKLNKWTKLWLETVIE